jgi:hypothetical protein
MIRSSMPSAFTLPAPLTEKADSSLSSIPRRMKPALPPPPSAGCKVRSSNTAGKP